MLKNSNSLQIVTPKTKSLLKKPSLSRIPAYSLKNSLQAETLLSMKQQNIVLPFNPVSNYLSYRKSIID